MFRVTLCSSSGGQLY